MSNKTIGAKSRVFAAVLISAMAAGLLAGCGNAAKTPAWAVDPNAQDEVVDNDPDWAQSITFVDSVKNPATPVWTEYDDTMRQVHVEADLEKREALMHHAEDLLMASGALIPLYYSTDTYLSKPEFEGYYQNLYGDRFFENITQNGEPAKTFRICVGPEPNSIDPQLNNTADALVYIRATFVGLYTTDKNEPEKIVPALADGEPEVSDDGLTYTIHLKKDLKWSDGETLDANDFIYSWNRGADPKTGSDYSNYFDAMLKNEDGTLAVTAPDPDTLTFTLEAPCAYMMDLLTNPVFMPIPQQSIEAADPTGTNPGAWIQEAGFVCNGPYVMSKWSHGEYMTMTRNPYYYDAENVKLDRLEAMLNGDPAAIIAAYRANNIDFTNAVPTDELPSFEGTPDLHNQDKLGITALSFNVDSKLFEGKTAEQAAAMRRAFSLLIDREYITDTIVKKGSTPATTIVPAAASNGRGGIFRENDADYRYPIPDDLGYFHVRVNTELAIELLEEAGYKFKKDGILSDETPITIDYLLATSGNATMAQSIQQDLAGVGITVNINSEEWATYLDDRQKGDYTMATYGWGLEYNDPTSILDNFTSTSGNDILRLGR